MKILVDTTISKVATVTLLDGDKTVLTKTGTDALVLVAEILKEKNLGINDASFELKNEPGSYTGLKVGATLINTLNFTKGKKEMVIPKYQPD